MKIFVTKKKQEAIYNEGFREGAGAACLAGLGVGIVLAAGKIVFGPAKWLYKKARGKDKELISYDEYLESIGVEPRIIDAMDIDDIAGVIATDTAEKIFDAVDDTDDEELDNALYEVAKSIVDDGDDEYDDEEDEDNIINKVAEEVGKSVQAAEQAAKKTTKTTRKKAAK